MITRNTILKIIYLTFFAAAIVVVSILLYRNYIAANINISANGDRQLLDFGEELGKKYVLVNIENSQGEIIIKKGLDSYCKSVLSGFEKTVKIDGIFLVGGERLIAISGPVGVHSRSKQFFYLDSEICPKPVSFAKDGVKVYNIYSDQPNFLEEDFNADGVVDFATEFRNYDLNPLVDGIREIYIYNRENHQFEFLKSEKYQQSENCLDCDGEIK